MDPDKIALRRGDFWTAIALVCLSLFFLSRTAMLPLLEVSAAGVAGEWYNSAALVPFLVFGALLVLSLVLLVIAVQEGGLPELAAVGRLTRPRMSRGAARLIMVAAILSAYIVALVPRVDFVLSSALTITALVFGFHPTRLRPAVIATVAVLVPALYALIAHFPSSAWQAPHDDDWLTLAVLAMLTALGLAEARLAEGRVGRVRLSAPVLALAIPFLLIVIMAFGFRQNVPNSGGLLFTKVQYHYYVTLRPLWQGP